MLDSIYHITLKLLETHFGMKTSNFSIFYATLKWTSLCNDFKSVNHYILVVYQFYCLDLFHSRTRSHVIRSHTPSVHMITAEVFSYGLLWKIEPRHVISNNVAF